MFRLVKSISTSNLSEDPVVLTKGGQDTFFPGSVITANNSLLTACEAAAFPDYVMLQSPFTVRNNKITCSPVTEDMIFKVEYTGTISPMVGMKVGISTNKRPSDAVTFNTNGKGVIVEIADNPKLVYVKFRRS